MKYRLFFFFVILLTFGSGYGQAQAQDSVGVMPLILWIRGDLYAALAFDSAPIPITTNGTISGPALSPDGKTIAYKAAAQVGLDALDRLETNGLIADFDLPGDIYLFDVADLDAVQAAGQPDDASLFEEDTPDKAIIRSSPVWSPDGKRLAWTEFTYPGGKPQIVVYDVARERSSVIAESIPAPLVQGAPPDLRWGDGVIAVNTSVDAAGEQDFLIYTDDGTLLSAPRFAPVDGDPALDFVWVQSPEGDLLGILYASARWTMVDPTTGVAQPVSEAPRLTTPTPDSQALGFGVDPTEGMFWEVLGGNAAAVGTPAQVTLSPSGQLIAFTGARSFGAVTVLDASGESVTIPNTGSNLDQLQVGALLWGATLWRIG